MTFNDKNYTELIDRINNLDNKISGLQNTENKTNPQPNPKINPKSSSGGSKKLCVFKKCPPGSTEKDKLLFGDNKNLCTFTECPPASTKIGTMGKGSSVKLLCGFDSCPKGSNELGKYVITKKNIK